jgi:hypothetical protein
MPRSLLCFIFLLAAATGVARAQGIGGSERFRVDAGDSIIALANDFILPGSLRLTLDSGYALQTPLDFLLDSRFGTIRLTPFFRRLLADTTHPHFITAEYRYRPLSLQREYYRRRLVEPTVDSAGRERRVAEERGGGLSSTGIFGKNFQRSGYVGRGFTVGSNRDLTIQSGLRLQFSGKITDDVEVLGAVTDEQTPIQPEGNTQTLREVDNIFIEFRSPHVGGTIGKFTAAGTASEFTSFSRKLQGVRAIGRYGPYGSTELVAAVAPGKFRTQQIAGRERDQGPYRLTGESGERTIVVVAGTERLFVDGVEMVRGESNDYVIDYSTAEIFFQTRRPITGASRITVDFEFSDRQYSRSFLAASSFGYLFDSTVSLTAGYLREADNPDAPLDITLTDTDRLLLEQAGGDPLRAVRSGAYIVGRDSTPGRYYRLDTLIDGAIETIYRYAPDSSISIYNVSFSLAPNGLGDYSSVAFGEYRYEGKGRGRYLPVIYLPLPQLTQVGSLRLAARPSRGIDLSAELAFSDASLNRFSQESAATPRGLAFSARAGGLVDSLRLSGLRLGSVRFAGNARFLQSTFRTIERLGEVEFNNRWNTSARLGESPVDDLLAEGSLSWYPIPRLEIQGAGGTLRRGDLFRSTRGLVGARYSGDSTLPELDYTAELIATSDSNDLGANGRWVKQRGGIRGRIGVLTPGARVEYEDRQERGGAGVRDTLSPSSFRFLELGPDLELNLGGIRAVARARYRIDDSVRYDPGIGERRFLRDGTAQTYTLRGEARGERNLSSTLDFTYRIKDYDSIASVDARGRLKNITILARSQTRWNAFDRGLDLDVLYDVQTEQAARLQRIYLKVPVGLGEYVWIDADSNGLQSTDEFRKTNAEDGEYQQFDLPTEQLYPVIDLRASLRVNLQPAKIVGATSALGALLAPVTSQTFLRVEEKSQTTRESDIYLLRTGSFQDDSTTLNGASIIQQDLNFFEANPEYSFRLRYLQGAGLTRLYNAIERRSNIERSLRTRWKPTSDIELKLDLGFNSGALLSSDSLSSRAYDLSALTASNDFSYFPEDALELGWRFRISSAEDVLPALPRTTVLTTNEIRAIYSLVSRGRIRAVLERSVVEGENIGSSELALPYQLTEGYAIGTTWVGRLQFEYRFGANIEARLGYTGRAQPPTDRVVHTAQAELKAIF